MRKIDLFLLLRNRERERNTRRSRREKFIHKLAATLLATLSLLTIGGVLVAGIYYARLTRDLPSIEELPLMMDKRSGELLQPTTILDRSGLSVFHTYDYPGIKREFLSVDPDSSDHISPQFLRAIITMLDPGFWQNPASNWKKWNDPNPQTIAERLVDNLLLWDEPQTLARAMRMRILAAQTVAKYGKTQVLEWYVNSAWFGQLAFGAESAAQLYLQKSARELTLAESTLLTPLLDSPALNPLDALDTSIQMQNALLKKMRSAGVIQQEEYEQALLEKLNLRQALAMELNVTDGFIKLVEHQLESTLGFERLQRGGLIITTTLDDNLQEQLNCTAIAQLNRIQINNASSFSGESENCPASLLLPTQSFNGQPEGSLSAAGVVMNPRSGEVLAYIQPVTGDGSSSTFSAFQPGSLLSPVVALTAFARGFSPSSLVWDVPPQLQPTGWQYSPGQYQGAITIREAVANEYLTSLANLVDQVGADNTWRTGAALGLTSLETAELNPAPLFNGMDSNLLDIASLYSTLADTGVHSGYLNKLDGEIHPNTVISVRTVSGRILLENRGPDQEAIVSDSLAYLVNHVLSDESARWPSLGFPNALEIGSNVAAKTGVAQNRHQVWTVGYTPDLLALVWMGDGLEEGTLALDPRMAAGIWHAVFRYQSAKTPPAEFVRPASVTEMKVCVPSGMLPTDRCPEIKNDVFLMGNEPTLPDTLFIKVKVNRETGQRATVFTPLELVEEIVYMDVPSTMRAWAEEAGIALAPSGYDSIQQILTDPEVNINSPALFSAVSGKVPIYGSASGTNFASYSIQVGEGINPENWQQIGDTQSKPIQNGLMTAWDTSGLNGLYAIRLSVLDRNMVIRTALSQVTVDNTPPTLHLTYPAPGQIAEPSRGGVTLTATADDLVGIDRVEWWVDGKLVLTQNQTPYAYFLERTSGKTVVQLKAWDLAGNPASTDKITFNISR